MGDWGALAVQTSRESDPEDGLMLGLTRLSGFMHKYMQNHEFDPSFNSNSRLHFAKL